MFDSVVFSSAGLTVCSSGSRSLKTCSTSSEVADCTIRRSPCEMSIGEGLRGITRSTNFCPNSVFGMISALTLAGMSLTCDGISLSFTTARRSLSARLTSETVPTMMPRSLTSAGTSSECPALLSCWLVVVQTGIPAGTAAETSAAVWVVGPVPPAAGGCWQPT